MVKYNPNIAPAIIVILVLLVFVLLLAHLLMTDAHGREIQTPRYMIEFHITLHGATLAEACEVEDQIKQIFTDTSRVEISAKATKTPHPIIIHGWNRVIMPDGRTLYRTGNGGWHTMDEIIDAAFDELNKLFMVPEDTTVFKN